MNSNAIQSALKYIVNADNFHTN